MNQPATATRDCGGRWLGFRLALIAVAGLAAIHAWAQSTPPEIVDIFFDNRPVRGTTYELGESIRVTVAGPLELRLTVGTSLRRARYYAAAYGGRELFFFYTVRAEDRDADGVSIPASAFSLRGGTVKAAADGKSNALLMHEAVAAEPGRKLDGSRVRAPPVRSVTYTHAPDPASGDTYGRGERIQVLVEFDRAVTVAGTPQIALRIGTRKRQASYFPIHFVDLGSSVYFTYTVQETDRDVDGISILANSLPSTAERSGSRAISPRKPY